MCIRDSSNWYLPSLDELNKLYLNRDAIGGFDTTSFPYYWSSSEYDADDAWGQGFSGGVRDRNWKYFPYRVRAVRGF